MPRPLFKSDRYIGVDELIEALVSSAPVDAGNKDPSEPKDEAPCSRAVYCKGLNKRGGQRVDIGHTTDMHGHDKRGGQNLRKT